MELIKKLPQLMPFFNKRYRKKTIVIINGEIPGTTFLQRHIKNISELKFHIILLGNFNGVWKEKTDNITVIGFKSNIHRVYVLLKYFLLILLFSPPTLLKYIQVNMRDLSFKKMVQHFPVLYSNPELIHIQWAKSIQEWFWIKHFGVKIILSLRGAHINYSPLADVNLAKQYQYLFPKIDAFHAVSRAIQNEALKYGLKKTKSKVIYSAIEINNTSKSKEEITHPKLKLLSVGRPHWKKGYLYSLDACAHLKSDGIEFNYMIIGGLSEENYFHIKDLDLEEHIIIRPHLKFNEIINEMENSSLLLLPSVEEGIANVVLEAMACGLPVLSSNCGGMQEIIKDGMNGFLFNRRDPIQISNKIKEFLSLNTNEIHRLIINAKKVIKDNHNSNNYTKDFDLFYSKVMKGKPVG